MNEITTDRGFQAIEHAPYPPGSEGGSRVVQQSSAIGDYEDSDARPGSSFLWFGGQHHLNREEVGAMVGYLQHWLEAGSLFDPAKRADDRHAERMNMVAPGEINQPMTWVDQSRTTLTKHLADIVRIAEAGPDGSDEDSLLVLMLARTFAFDTPVRERADRPERT